jgi:hypothetical protein
MQRILQETRTLTKHSTRDPNMSESGKFDLSDVFQTALRVIKDPAGFYRTMPRDGGYAQPLIFIAVMAVFTGIMMAILSLFGGGRPGGINVGLASVFIIPIVMIIGYSIAAVILFVIWKLMGSTQNYQTAFRCQAFASSILPVTALFSLITLPGHPRQYRLGHLAGYQCQCRSARYRPAKGYGGIRHIGRLNDVLQLQQRTNGPADAGTRWKHGCAA